MYLLFLAIAFLLSIFAFQSAPPNTDVAPIIGLIMARALQLTAVVKIVVDGLIKDHVPGAYLPFVACAVGVLVDFGILALQAVAGSSVFTLQNSVMALFAGVLAGIGSKVLTAVHDSANPTS